MDSWKCRAATPGPEKASKLQARRAGIVKLGIEHVLSECRRRPLKFGRGEGEECNNITLSIWRKLVEVLLDHGVSTLARSSLKTRIDDSHSNGCGIVTIGICLLKMLLEQIFDHPGFISTVGFPGGGCGCRHVICSSMALIGRDVFCGACFQSARAAPRRAGASTNQDMTAEGAVLRLPPISRIVKVLSSQAGAWAGASCIVRTSPCLPFVCWPLF